MQFSVFADADFDAGQGAADPRIGVALALVPWDLAVLEIVDDLIAYPVITVSQAAGLHGVTFPPANNAIQKLVELGFLTEVTGSNYNRIFVCREIMTAVESPNP